MSDARTILLPATEREPVIERVGKILLSAFSGSGVLAAVFSEIRR